MPREREATIVVTEELQKASVASSSKAADGTKDEKWGLSGGAQQGRDHR